MNDDQTEVELIASGSSGGPDNATSGEPATRNDRRMVVPVALLIAGAVGLLLLANGDPARAPQPPDPSVASPEERFDAVQVANAVPPPLLSAELFAAEPSAQGLRNLLEALGGFEALEIAAVEGSFDLVRFDPEDPSRLLASRRSSYGDAENQAVNEMWTITDAGHVEQEIWEPSISHDFVHYNGDGSATMWVHGGGEGFSPRIAVTLGPDFEPVTTTEPMYASRFTATDDAVFALTGNGDYYSNESGYVDLVADNGSGLQVLDDGSQYAWIDNPTPEIMLAYPAERDGRLTVWSATSLDRLPLHPLAGRPYRRVAVSADRAVALGATFDGELETVDLSTGRTVGAFASVDVSGVDQPITLNNDGTIAWTVERSGLVSMWWVGDDTPIASVEGHQAQPRWVSAEYAPRSASVVSADTVRVALLASARPSTPTKWTIIDSDPASWIERACTLAGRALTEQEVDALGLGNRPRACHG